uniref:Uncharacterized protein n=1 Tax=Octopus bimaculoides TaxID=37653 RepID=A0A0L8HP45_OCTBM
MVLQLRLGCCLSSLHQRVFHGLAKAGPQYSD